MLKGSEETLRNIKTTYDEISMSQIKELWKNDSKEINVYVHNPFCKTICKYCYYKGSIYNENNYFDYYSNYLPKSVNNFLDILKTKTIKNYFFGGGTPNLGTTKDMENMFNLFPSFKQIESKAIELHPAYATKEQIDVLAEYKFNCIILGVQSFNEEVLNNQNRPYCSFEKIKDLIDYIKMKGIFVAVDSICFIDGYTEKDLNIFINDVSLIAALEPDEISLQTNYDIIENESLNKAFIDVIYNGTVLEKYNFLGDYESFLKTKQNSKVIRVIKKNISIEDFDIKYFPFLYTLDELSKDVERKYSLMSFGAFNNLVKNTFSIIGDSTEYIEINENSTPTYYNTYRKLDFFDEVEKFFNKIKKIGPPPCGLNFVLENASAVENENTIYRKQSTIITEIRWNITTPEIEEYNKKLMKSFPELNW